MTRCAAVLLLAGTVCFASPPADQKPQVHASFLPLYCFTANVAGDRANAAALLTGAVSPHDYQFTPRDMKRLNEADLLVTLGLGFEPWAARAREDTRARVIEAAAGLREQLIYGSCGHDHGEHAHHAEHAGNSANPHVWLDPQLAMLCVSNISTALGSLDPANGAFYSSNATAYIERLRSLDKQIADNLRPFTGAAVISYHDALPYFARRYGLTIAAVVQPVPEVSPSLRRIAELRGLVREKQVKALLVDAHERPALAERISKEFRLPIVVFDTIETGAPSPDAYEKIMQANAAALARALK